MSMFGPESGQKCVFCKICPRNYVFERDGWKPPKSHTNEGKENVNRGKQLFNIDKIVMCDVCYVLLNTNMLKSNFNILFLTKSVNWARKIAKSVMCWMLTWGESERGGEGG